MKKTRTFVGDFETTVYKGQVRTDVWAAALVELGSDEVRIDGSIGEHYRYLLSQGCDIVVYYHNLKFDGSFWLDYIINVLKLNPGYIVLNDNETKVKFLTQKELRNGEYIYSISDMGQWYKIVLKVDGKTIELRDSLKLLPFSVREIGKGFATKHKKLEMEYEGERYPGCQITDEEREYIANDVLVVKEALEIMFEEGHNKLTIGSCCMHEYKCIVNGYDATKINSKRYEKTDFELLFPNVYEDESPFEGESAGDFIHKAYRGGWCYLARGKENKIYTNGITLDVNSLYPSMMHSMSGNRYPVGHPIFWKGNYIPYPARQKNAYYFVRIRTRFQIKKGYLPFIQIKNNFLYKSTENLETSDIRMVHGYCKSYRDRYGNIHPATVELTMTMTDYELLTEHYDLQDFEIIGGCYFETEIGLFDEYIDKYKKIKMESTGARRTIAKLFLNNLYGKMATSKDSSFKVAYARDDGSVGFYTVLESEKEPGYIPIGAAITSYARNFTIRAAQENYCGKDKPGFIYSDTDSIHINLPIDSIKGVKLSDHDFCAWKVESAWDAGIFVRQKTYIEKTGDKYDVKCAGMPDHCKKLFIQSITGDGDEAEDEEELEFVSTKRKLSDFCRGLKVPGKLLPLRIPGGLLLVKTTYELK